MRVVFIFLLLVVTGNCAAQSKQPLTAIAFYNVENLFDIYDAPDKDDDAFTPNGAYKYTQEVYQKKLRNIAYVLKQLATTEAPAGPALVGLAEVENGKVLQDLIVQREISNRGYQYIWFDSWDPRGIDVALLYQPRYFRPLMQKPVNVNLPNEPTRDILYVAGILNSDTVHVLVNHWPSRREGKDVTEPKRLAVAAINRKIADSLLTKNPAAKIIIMGDLNDDPVETSVAHVLGAKDKKPEAGKTSLYNPWAEIYKTGTGSLAYKDKWNLFDQIIISVSFLQKNKDLQFHKAEVFNKDFLKTRSGRFQGYPRRSFGGTKWLNGYSDHFPVVLYLRRN